MRYKRAITSGGAVLAALALPGCVMAIPFAAAGAMAGSRGVRGETIESVGQRRADAANENASASRSAAADDPNDYGGTAFVVSDLTELPPPSGRTERLPSLTVQNFAAYAQQKAASDTALSARLTDPGSIRAERAACGARPAVVLVDLDPGREAIDPFEPILADPALADALNRLRSAGIAVAWQSRLGEGFAEPLREGLASSGLDPAGADRLLLLPSIDERTQTQREALDTSHCIVAMLGDERADFDELFLYLKNPDAAIGLDRMIGDGWFIDPGVLTSSLETN